ncbi:sensor histidine kinase [Butyrivibrio sp. VCB2001]|uniref:sensor histidine kinase n=1 Tax=Butyrivibrio sp. VCB2001 TaxID=1280667 RepID=UPI00041FEAA7|nr:histidine kinase [Butyrivibrio sp. VCB2001]
MKNTGRTRSYPVVQMLTKTLYLAIPVVILFVVVSWFSFSEIRKQNNLALKSSVNIYQNELEHKLSAIEHFVQWTVVHDPILDAFDESGHMGDFRDASNELRLRVSDMQYSTGSEYMYFFYWDEKDIFFNASDLKVNYETYKKIKERIKSDVGTNYTWEPCMIGDNAFLYYSITYEHRIFSCVVSMEDILSPLSSINLGEQGSIQALSADGDVFYRTGEGPGGFRGNFYNRLIFPGAEADLPFTLAIDSLALGNYGRLFFLQFIVFLAALMLCFIMGGYVLVSYRKVILPIKIFSKSLSEIDSLKDTEGLVLTDSRVQELNQINDQFKNLIHEITRLRIDVYEAELDNNKFMIHFLQQQIKPHFYLNCLTTIDSMVSLGDMDAAKKMLMFTSRYFRYLFQVNNNFVPLINELAHVEDYLSIQNMRLSRPTQYETDLPKDCNQLSIPPLLLITFVENSVKHATPPEGESLKISIRAKKLLDAEDGAGDILEIVISDNGQGFDPQILNKIKNGEDIVSEDGSHIGITNCIKRLSLLYNNSFELIADNTEEHGARITLRIPVKV